MGCALADRNLRHRERRMIHKTYVSVGWPSALFGAALETTKKQENPRRLGPRGPRRELNTREGGLHVVGVGEIVVALRAVLALRGRQMF